MAELDAWGMGSRIAVSIISIQRARLMDNGKFQLFWVEGAGEEDRA